MTPIISANGKGLINSPVLELDNKALFNAILRKLADFDCISGQVTLSLSETLAFRNADITVTEENFRADNQVCNPNAFLDEFNMNKVDKRSFALNHNRVLPSPQEARAAANLSIKSFHI